MAIDMMGPITQETGGFQMPLQVGSVVAGQELVILCFSVFKK